MLLFLILLFCLVRSYNILALELDLAREPYSESERILFDSYSDLNITWSKKLPNYDFILENFDLLMVISASDIAMVSLNEIASVREVPVIVLGKGKNSNWVFFTEPDDSCYDKNLLALVDYLGMQNLVVIWSYSREKLETVKKLKATRDVIRSASIAGNLNQEKVSEMFGKFVKSKGISEFLILVEANLCKMIQESIRILNLEKIWNLAVYGEECSLNLHRSGSISLAYGRLENLHSDKLYNLNPIFHNLDKITAKGYTRYQIKNQLKLLNMDCVHSIINYRDQNVIAGEIVDGKISNNTEIAYFRGESVRSKVKKPPIRISANTGILNPPGFKNATQNSMYHQGTYFGVKQLKSSNELLSGFELELYDKVNCGVSTYVHDFSKMCFNKIQNELGVAYIPSFYSSTIETLGLFKELDIQIPVIAGMGSSTILSNYTKYPTFFRLVSPLNFIVWSSIGVMKKLKWKNLIIFYSNDPWGIDLYNVVLYQESIGTLKILNKEEYRKISYESVDLFKHNYSENIKDALDTGCILMFLLMSDPAPFYFLETLYDNGIRRGDFVYFFLTPSGTDQLNSPEGNYLKRAELFHGSYIIYNAMWQDKFSWTIKYEFDKTGTTWFPGYYIDTVTSIAKTIQYLLDHGKDYENTTAFVEAFRYSRFRGATGYVSFDSILNDRNLYFFSVYNIYEKPESKKFVTENTAFISPLTSLYFIYNSSVWPVSGGTIPDDMKINYFNCPIYQDHVVIAKQSGIIQLSLCLSILVVSCTLTFILARKTKLAGLKLMTKVLYVQASDYFEVFFILIEPIQMTSLGPPLDKLNKVLYAIANFFSIKLISAFSLRDKHYWSVYFIGLLIGYTWILICLLSCQRLEKVLKGFSVKLNSLKLTLTPFMVSFLFIPLLTTNLSIFSCRYTEKREENAPFLDYDCNFKCWEGNHSIFILLSTVLIILQPPMSLVYRARWQALDSGVSIKSDEYYCLIKNLISMFLISTERLISEQSELAFALVFLLGIVTIQIYLFKNFAYNYDRANLWIKVVVWCVIWNTLLYILNLFVPFDYYIYIDFFGIFIAVGIGIWFHRKLPPSKLLVKEGKTVFQMLRFAYDMGMFDIKSLRSPSIRSNSIRRKSSNLKRSIAGFKNSKITPFG